MIPLLVPLIAAGVSAVGGLLANRAQKKSNMELAKFQADENRKLLNDQLTYNTPKAQMARFKEAGLNKALMYGQGNPGNQSAPLSYPDIAKTDITALASNILPNVSQLMMTQAQVGALDAKTRNTYAQTELNKIQQRLLAANPLLDDEGFKATIDGLKATAELKQQDAGLRAIQRDVADKSSGHIVSKLFHEVELLEQRFNLGQQDAAIKAQVLKSKEFQNAILEVQKKFMTDGDVTPQHILQFIQMLLLKMF